MSTKEQLISDLLKTASDVSETGEARAAALISVPDKIVTRAIRKANPNELKGLLLLLAQLPKRARGIAEDLMASAKVSAELRSNARQLLWNMSPPHPLDRADLALEASLEKDHDEDLAKAFQDIAPKLRQAWCQLNAAKLLTAKPARGAMILDHDANLAGALAEALAHLGTEDAARWLGEVATHMGNPVSTKALKKAAYKLRQAGRDVELPGAPAASILETEELRAEAYASSFDPDGERAIWIGEEKPSGGFQVSQALISMRIGVRDFEWGDMRARDFERFITDIHKQSWVISRIPRRHALGLLEEAYFFNPAASSKAYRHFRVSEQIASRALLEPPRQSDPSTPPDSVLANIDKLLDHAVTKGWILPEALVSEIPSKDSSGIVLPGHLEQSRSEETLAAALDKHIDKAVMQNWQRRCEETSLMLSALDEPELTEIALSAALDLAAHGPSKSKLLLALLRRTIQSEPAEEPSDDATGIIVPPA